MGRGAWQATAYRIAKESDTTEQLKINNLLQGTHQGSVQFSCSVVSDSATPWTAALQASLSFTISQSLLKLMSLELVMPSNHCILCRPLLFLPCQGAMGPNLGLVTLLKEKSNQKEAEEKMNGW